MQYRCKAELAANIERSQGGQPVYVQTLPGNPKFTGFTLGIHNYSEHVPSHFPKPHFNAAIGDFVFSAGLLISGEYEMFSLTDTP